MRSLECPRCYRDFASILALNEHQRTIQTCELRERSATEEITKEQEKQLRKRNNDPSQNEEDKWREVYKNLFPGDPEVPSPCQYPVASGSQNYWTNRSVVYEYRSMVEEAAHQEELFRHGNRDHYFKRLIEEPVTPSQIRQWIKSARQLN